MKCPRCGNNHQHKYGMMCRCGYRFALDPKIDGVSDRRFVAFINGASCNGTYSFTENQFYTAACRKQLTSPIGFPGVLVLAALLAVFTGLGVVADVLFFFVFSVGFLVLTLGSLGVWIWFRFLKPLSVSRLDGWTRKYTAFHGPIKGMITAAQLTEPPEDAAEPDIYDYGVERVLIVQRPILVDLLIANNIHMANRSVIASADGYPTYIEAIVQKLLEDSPTLPVFLLHDADEIGLDWAQQQAARYESPDRPIVDMGLGFETVKKIRKLRSLRLRGKRYQVPVDVLPMAMLANGIALSMERQVGMKELLINETSVDASASFG